VKALALSVQCEDQLAFGMRAQSVRIVFAGDGERLASDGRVELALAPILRGLLRVGWIEIDATVFLCPLRDGMTCCHLHRGHTPEPDIFFADVTDAGLEEHAGHHREPVRTAA